MTETVQREEGRAELIGPLLALTQAGIPTDVQELLVHGNPSRGIAPGALAKALQALSPPSIGEGTQDAGASAAPTALSSLRDEAPDGSSPSGLQSTGAADRPHKCSSCGEGLDRREGPLGISYQCTAPDCYETYAPEEIEEQANEPR